MSGKLFPCNRNRALYAQPCDGCDCEAVALSDERRPRFVRTDAERIRELDEALEQAVKMSNDLAAEVVALQEALRRSLTLAEGMFQMIPPEVWREHGGDDGQGHYEGDYHAEKVQDELVALRGSVGDSE